MTKPILVGHYTGKTMREYFKANSWATAAVETDDKVYPAAYLLNPDNRTSWTPSHPQRIAYAVGENKWEVTDVPRTSRVTQVKWKGSTQ